MIPNRCSVIGPSEVLVNVYNAENAELHIVIVPRMDEASDSISSTRNARVAACLLIAGVFRVDTRLVKGSDDLPH